MCILNHTSFKQLCILYCSHGNTWQAPGLLLQPASVVVSAKVSYPGPHSYVTNINKINLLFHSQQITISIFIWRGIYYYILVIVLLVQLTTVAVL